MNKSLVVALPLSMSKGFGDKISLATEADYVPDNDVSGSTGNENVYDRTN